MPNNHRCFRGKEIAALLVASDEAAVRSAIRRAREELAEAELDLYGATADPNAIIERVTKGYRINPKVMPLKLDEYRRR